MPKNDCIPPDVFGYFSRSHWGQWHNGRLSSRPSRLHDIVPDPTPDVLTALILQEEIRVPLDVIMGFPEVAA